MRGLISERFLKRFTRNLKHLQKKTPLIMEMHSVDEPDKEIGEKKDFEKEGVDRKEEDNNKTHTNLNEI